MLRQLQFADDYSLSNGDIGNIATYTVVEPTFEQPLILEPLNIPPRIVKNNVSTGEIAADILPSPPQLADEPTPTIKGGFMTPVSIAAAPINEPTTTAPAPAAPAKKATQTDYKKWFKIALIIIAVIVLIRVFK